MLDSDKFENVIAISSVNIENKFEQRASRLAKLWNIGLKTAQRTLRATTQVSLRYLKGKIHRRDRTKVHQRRYNQLGGYLERFASDIFTSNVKSMRGNIKFQLFCNRCQYVKVYPMKQETDAHHMLNRFLHEVGIPIEIHTDGVKSLSLDEWAKICRKYKINQTTTN